MSLLFDRQTFVKTTFHLKGIPDKGGLDTVLIGKALWNAISPVSSIQYPCLSIQPLQRASVPHHSTLDTLICWAIVDEETDDLAIPPGWCKIYGHIFPRSHADGQKLSPSLLISQAEPVLLTEVITTALSTDAYGLALRNSSILETWLSSERTILRHGTTHIFTSEQLPMNGSNSISTKSFGYRLDMTEPVLQGFARRGSTKFIVTLDSTDNTAKSFPSPAVEGETEDNSESIEIGERFLAISTFPPSFEVLRPPVNVITSNDTCSSTDCVTEISFSIKPLLQPVNITDDQCTLYLRTTDLGKIGLLNGDWAMAESFGKLKYRLVRIIANDTLVDIAGVAAGSPTLLHNLCSGSFDTSHSEMKRIILHSTPFGSRGPVIPVAKTITLARVASPLSVDRTYQPLFLGSLRKYFNSSKHLMKRGDIIAVSFDADNLNHLQEGTDDNQMHMNASEDYRLLVFPPCSSEVVFFYVTNVEYDIIKNDSNPDMYLSSTIGELGCWIDPSITRIVQTGIEHCWIPDVGTYFESVSLRSYYSILTNMPYSHLLGPNSRFDKLASFISAVLARHAVDYDLNVSVLLKGGRGTGKFTATFWVAQQFGMHLFEVNCYDVIGGNDIETEGILRARFDKAKSCSPCIFVLRHIEALAQATQVLESGKEPITAKILHECINDVQKDWKITGYPVIVVGMTSEPNRVPSSVLSSFKHEILFEAPGEKERQEILECFLVNTALAPDVSLSSLATHTAALVASDLIDLVSGAKSTSIERASFSAGYYASHLAQAGIALTAADFDVALNKVRRSYSESIGAPKIPNVSWDDIGGLAQVKADILDTIQLPLEHPELFADGLKKRSGILLYGPPGTGKTLLAKAVATSCSLNFFSIKGPELLNMYIGESEANVRRVFQRARDAKPCVVFFDELDSIAPKRGNQGDSGGVMDRIVSQLLAELDGMASGHDGINVFVVGATNRPDLLDPALLRPGRFDRLLYLGVSETHEAQANILEALTRKFRLDVDLDLHQLADRCPMNYTGADFYALCSDAMLNAMSRKAEAIETKIAHWNRVPQSGHPHPLTPQFFLAEMASAEDLNVLVSQKDFDIALANLIPSVSLSEMDHYTRIQHRFSGDKTEP